jgi:glycosyltransferase involved in cell wall biosynthesis
LKQSIDIQILEMEESFGWSAAVSAASIVRVVVRLHGPWFLTGAFDSSPATTFQDRIEREGLGISRAAIVTSPSRAGLDAVRDRYRLALDNARVIPNPIEPVPPGIQWRLGACAQDRILFIGRFDLLKGADLVLRAFQVLAPRHPNLRLTFAGPDRGLFEEGENLSIGQFIRKHMPELESRIDYLGVVHREELLQLRQQHLFTIVASRFEMFSYAVAEAMASGCPIIASSAGAIPELISDGATGLLFESGSISALVNRCERLFNDHELLNRLGAEAKRFSEERLRPALLAKETEAAYELALKSHRHFN